MQANAGAALARRLRLATYRWAISRELQPLPTKHILVVDDDPLILEVIERALSAADFRVSKARRVAFARDVLARQSVDLIVADARIPGETGLQLAEKARELGIAMILMTGDLEWASEHGMAAGQYLAKPFDLVELLERVRASL